MLFTGWLVLGIVLLLGYAGLMLVWWRAWQSMKKPESDWSDYPAPQPVAVIVPARNEAQNIEKCIASIMAQDYPLDRIEVLVVNDHSEDSTAEIVSALGARHPQIKLLSNKGYGKKAAIKTGIEAATAEWVICTDADCTYPLGWINQMTVERWKGTRFVAGPVLLKSAPGLLAIFQQLDFVMMQGITAAAVSKGWMSMCNGANIAYRRQDFFAVNGFEGIDGVPTGDDMLLMHKITETYPGTAVWLRNSHAIVTTPACPDWKSFMQQRIRWGSKATVFKDKRIFWVLLLVYCFNCWLLVSVLLPWWLPKLLLPVLLILLLKTAAELPLMHGTAGFFGIRNRLFWFAWLQPLHICYIVVAGWLGRFGSYRWKGRTIALKNK